MQTHFNGDACRLMGFILACCSMPSISFPESDQHARRAMAKWARPGAKIQMFVGFFTAN